MPTLKENSVTMFERGDQTTRSCIVFQEQDLAENLNIYAHIYIGLGTDLTIEKL